MFFEISFHQILVGNFIFPWISALQEEIMDAGLYIAPGTKFYCISPGWMRLVFTVPKQELNEGN